MSLINFQFGDFESASSPSWFDWLSLSVMILTIYSAYFFGERTYKRDKKNKKIEEEKNIKAENDLFTDNLKELQENILVQIGFLENYIKEQNFRLQINPALHTNFLNFITVKPLYSKKNLSEIETINKLLANLYLKAYRFSNNE